MKNLSYEEAAQRLNISIPQLKNLLREYDVKRFSDAPRSPYVITDRTIDILANRSKTPGRAAIRCEPCKHQPKKVCASCKRSMCLKDYRTQAKTQMPSARCKDCEYKAKLAKRK
jgi:hypothetical protein